MGIDEHRTDDAVAVLAPVESVPSLSDRVYQTLKQYVLDQRLKPGSKLSVPRLAQQLAVSRTPVKEAIERLGQEGLVTTLPNRGAFVAIIRPEDVEEIYQMREMLEGLASRLAALKVDPEMIADLRRLLEQGKVAVRRGDVTAHTSFDLEFHRIIRKKADNRRLIRALDNLQDQIRVVFRTSAIIPGRMASAIQEHSRIIEALEARDPDRAEEMTRAHVRQIREAVLEYMEAGGATGLSEQGD